MQAAALVIVIVFALWIGAAGVAALLRPARARGWIGRFASSHAVNIAEQAWRGLAGAALILRAPRSLEPEIFALAGWVLVATSAALLVIPLRWHAGFARYWAEHLPIALVRLAGLAALAIAGWLARAAIG